MEKEKVSSVGNGTDEDIVRGRASNTSHQRSTRHSPRSNVKQFSCNVCERKFLSRVIF